MSGALLCVWEGELGGPPVRTGSGIGEIEGLLVYL